VTFFGWEGVRWPQAWRKVMAAYRQRMTRKVTSGVTACTAGLALGPALGSEYFTLLRMKWQQWLTSYFLYMLSWMSSSSLVTQSAAVSILSVILAEVSRWTATNSPFSMSRGPTSMRTGTPYIHRPMKSAKTCVFWFSYVENFLHFNLVVFPVDFMNKLFPYIMVMEFQKFACI